MREIKNFLNLYIMIGLITFILTNDINKEEHSQFKWNEKILRIKGTELDDKILCHYADNKLNLHEKWFLIFYSRDCNYCKYAISTLNSKIVSFYKEEPEVNFAIIDLDSNVNIWVAFRFNITRIPYIIMIENGLMYQYKEPFETENVIKFINAEKNYEDGKDIPEEITWTGKIYYILNQAAYLIDEFVMKIFKKYKINIPWKRDYSVALVIVIISICIILEYKLVSILFNFCPRKKNVIHPIKKEEQQQSEDKNNFESKENIKEKKD